MNHSNEVIDVNRNHVSDLIFPNGFGLQSGTRTFCIILIVLCFIGIIAGILLSITSMITAGIIGFIPCVIGLTYKIGTEISTSSNGIREYNLILGKKRGVWRVLSRYTDLAILTIRKKVVNEMNIGGYGAMTTYLPQVNTEYEFKETGVYLLLSNHRKRILLITCKSHQHADMKAKELAEQLKKNYTLFSPKLTQASLDKRKRR